MSVDDTIYFEHSNVHKDAWGDWTLYDLYGNYVRDYRSKRAAVNGAKRYELHLNDHLEMIEHGAYRGYIILELNKDCDEFKKGQFVAVERTDYERYHPDLSDLSSEFEGSSAEEIRSQIDKYWKFELEESEKTALKKFEFTDETTECEGHLLHRIRACITFRVHGVCSEEVSAGDLGGFLEKESNLSQTDHSWVFDDATVYGDAYVCNGACITDYATVSENAVISEASAVNGFTQVGEFAVITGRARIYGDASILGNAVVMDNARVEQHAVICDHAVISGNARVFGTASASGNARIMDNAIVQGVAKVSGETCVAGSTVIGDQKAWHKSVEERFAKDLADKQRELDIER